MKSFSISVLILALFASTFACSNAEPEQRVSYKKQATVVNTSNSSGQTSLTLSWQPQDVSVFHVFYRDAKNEAREIDSVQKGDPNFNAPKIIIDESNLEQWPEVGAKTCFFVTAEYVGISSDASSDVCIVL